MTKLYRGTRKLYAVTNSSNDHSNLRPHHRRDLARILTNISFAHRCVRVIVGTAFLSVVLNFVEPFLPAFESIRYFGLLNYYRPIIIGRLVLSGWVNDYGNLWLFFVDRALTLITVCLQKFRSARLSDPGPHFQYRLPGRSTSKVGLMLNSSRTIVLGKI